MYNILFFLLAAVFALISWRDFRLALFLFLALLPSYLLRQELFGFPTTLLEILFLILAATWFLRGLKERPDLSFLKTWVAPMFVLFVASTIGIFVSPDPAAALGVWKAYFLEPMLFFVILRSTLHESDDAEKAFIALGAGALAISLFAIFQKLTSLGIPIPWDIEGRVTSVFPYPNALGLYLSPILILGLFAFERALRAKNSPRVWFWFLTIGTASAAIIFSQTEAAWVSIPATILVMGLLTKKCRAISAAVFVLFLLIVFFLPTLQNKLLLQDYSGQVRQKQWTETVSLLQDQPLFGAGLSGYPIALEPYHTHEEIEIFQYPHNVVLNVWVELGLLGLMGLLGLTAVTLQQLRLAVRRPSAFRWLALGCFAALLQMTIHGLVDVPYFKNDLSMLTWAILALLSWSATSPYVVSGQK